MEKDHKNIDKQPCPYVDCGSSDAFSFNTRGFGKCFSCGRSYPTSTEVFEGTDERYPPLGNFKLVFGGGSLDTKEVDESKESKSEYVAMRGLSARTMEKYDVVTSKDKTQQIYKYPSGGKKVRNLVEKGFFATKGFHADEFFGMDKFVAGCSKVLTITEGELDALSAYQMLNDVGGSHIYPVVSLPSATPPKSIWEKCKPYLDSFDKIVLSVDNDDAGNQVADRIFKLFPNKTYRVSHGSFKDANDFLVAGSKVEFKSAWFNARKHTPENVLNTTDQFLKLYEDTPDYQYVPTGINELDAKVLGLMQGHFTVIKAPTGIGKTEIMRFLEYNMIKRGVPIASWHLEETKLRSLLGLVSYEANDNLTRRDLIEQKGAEDTVKAAIHTLTQDENFYQFYLEDGQGADELCDQIRFFSQAAGCKFVFFEPIQDVVTGSTEDSKEQQLADLSVRLSKMAADLNVGIVTIAHTNENGDPKYCKMIGQRASVIIDLSRDKEASCSEEKNTTYIRVEKNRPCSQEGPAGKMKFNYDTFTLREVI